MKFLASVSSRVVFPDPVPQSAILFYLLTSIKMRLGFYKLNGVKEYLFSLFNEKGRRQSRYVCNYDSGDFTYWNCTRMEYKLTEIISILKFGIIYYFPCGNWI